MNKGQLNKALDSVDMVYNDLVVIANSIIDPYVQPINEYINQATDKDNLSNDEIRELMFRLALKSYSFSEIKEKSSLKAECAETLRKESYAKKFNSLDGTVAYKENQAIVETSEELLTETIYELVSDLFKTKLDELHRVVDVLKTILMSRNSEAKLSQGIIEP